LIIFIKHQQDRHTSKEDLGGHPEYKKILISSPAMAAASLGLARWQHPCKLQLPEVWLIGNNLANYSILLRSGSLATILQITGSLATILQITASFSGLAQ
jgi:hypothetical protein